MDAFYAAVEQRDRPELRGKAVIVGGATQGRGVVCAASYEARKFGVHSAMPAVTARRLCPHGVFLPPRMEDYAGVSREIRKIFERFTPLVEPLSLDEAFLDVTGSKGLFGTSVEIGHQIKQAIRDELSLVASVGVAPNKFLAKIASDLEKPDGFTMVDPDGVQAFLDPLPVGRLWGVGRVTGRVFETMRIRTIGDLRRLPTEILRDKFGEHGEHLGRLAHGIDERDVIPDRQAKSISHETTFAQDVDDDDALRAWIVELSDQVARRLRRQEIQCRTVNLKVRFRDFRTVTRACSLDQPSNSTAEICGAALDLFTNKMPADRLAVRLLGVGVSRFGEASSRQLSLFAEDDPRPQVKIDSATDAIRDRFGRAALRRGSSMLHNARHRPQPRPDDK